MIKKFRIFYLDMNRNLEIMHIGPARDAEHAKVIFTQIYGPIPSNRIQRVEEIPNPMKGCPPWL